MNLNQNQLLLLAINLNKLIKPEVQISSSKQNKSRRTLRCDLSLANINYFWNQEEYENDLVLCKSNYCTQQSKLTYFKGNQDRLNSFF